MRNLSYTILVLTLLTSCKSNTDIFAHSNFKLINVRYFKDTTSVYDSLFVSTLDTGLIYLAGYYKNGKLYGESYYFHQKKYGTWKMYDQKGNKIQEVKFENGEPLEENKSK